MRVDILTLTTASAAALTIGLASPALGAGAPSVGSHAGARHVAAAQGAMHGPALAHRDGDGDGDGDGDHGGGGDDGGADVNQHKCDGASCGGFRHRTCHSPSCFHGFRHGGPFVFGGSGFGGGGFGGGGNAEGFSSQSWESGPPPMERRPMRKRPARPQVRMVPRGPAMAGFGGSQDSGVPLGIAGLSLILGGAGLLVARRRIRASARS